MADQSNRLKSSLVKSGIPEEAFGPHAGILDVSLLLAVDTSLVRLDRMAHLGNDKQENFKLRFFGDPKRATAQIGAKFIEVTIQTSVNQVLLLKKENRK